MSKLEERIEVNKRLIGKTVLVSDGDEWYGEVLEVLDADTFVIKKGGIPVKVDIFDIRNPE